MQFTNRVTSITQDTILPKVFDNILSDNFAAFRFISNGSKWSGETLKRPVKLVQSTLGGSFAGLDTHSTSTTESRRTMSYSLKAYEIPVAIAGLDRLVNATEAKVIDLVKAEMESAAQDAMDDIGDMFYLDGTGNSSKDFEGLQNLVDDGTTATNVGGLSRTTWTSLQGTRTASGGQMTLTKLGTLYVNVAGGSAARQKPTIIVSDETVWNLYEALLSPTVQAGYQMNGYPQVTRRSRGAIAAGEFKGGMGFTSLIYRGVPWVADELSLSQTVWFLNENYLNWYGLKDPEMTSVNFGSTHEGTYSEAPTNNTGLQIGDFMKPVNQYGQIGHIYLFGNLVTFQPRRHGRLTGVTSS